MARRMTDPTPTAAIAGNGGTMDTLAQDVRYALRALAQQRAFAIVAVVTLAPRSRRQRGDLLRRERDAPAATALSAAERLVMVWTTTGAGQSASPGRKYLDWRASRAPSRDGGGRHQSVTLVGGAEPERVTGAFVSSTLFELVGARPELGRTFRRRRRIPRPAQPVAVISHGLWTRRFGADPAILGGR
jgi:hypothetical protein